MMMMTTISSSFSSLLVLKAIAKSAGLNVKRPLSEIFKLEHYDNNLSHSNNVQQTPGDKAQNLGDKSQLEQDLMTA